MFYGARGTMSHRPLNLALATFSSNHTVNELSLNSSFSFGYAIYSLRHEVNPAKLYKSKMEKDEIIRRVRKYLEGRWVHSF